MKRRVLARATHVLAVGLLLSGLVSAEARASAGGAANAAGADSRVDQAEAVQRLALLELAVKPQSPDEAIDLFVQSYQLRNGALLFAIMTPEERSRRVEWLSEQNWVLGVSSPWIKGYRVERRDERGGEAIDYHLHLLEYTSAGFAGAEHVMVTVKRQEGEWLIDRHTPVTFRTDLDLMSENLTEDTVLALVAEARQRVAHVAGGGNQVGAFRFQPPGMDAPYRWLSEEMGTLEQLTAYLQDVFAAEAVSAHLEAQLSHKRLIELGGRLAQPDGNPENFGDWTTAKLVKLTVEGKRGSAVLSVPVGNDAWETRAVPLVYQDRDGWRIAASPDLLR